MEAGTYVKNPLRSIRRTRRLVRTFTCSSVVLSLLQNMLIGAFKSHFSECKSLTICAWCKGTTVSIRRYRCTSMGYWNDWNHSDLWKGLNRILQSRNHLIGWPIGCKINQYFKSYQRHNAGAIKAIYNKMQNVIISCSGRFSLAFRSCPIRKWHCENSNLSWPWFTFVW